jgi:hypothetical protein
MTSTDYENFEKGMIYMKILKKGGGGNEIHTVMTLNFSTKIYCVHRTLSPAK